MTNNSSENKQLLSSVNSKWAVPMVFLTVGNILGNALVLISAWRNRSLRKQGRCYIVSLAVADLLVGLIVCPVRVVQFIIDYSLSVDFCICYVWVDALCSTASITTLTVISVDRCYKISYPFHYKVKVTSRWCILIVSVVWLYSAIVTTLGTIPYNNETKIFIGLNGQCANPKPIFYLTVFTIVFALPSVILVISYILIFIVAYRRRRKWSKQNEAVSAGERRMFLKDLKNAKTLAIVVLAFMVCRGPLIVMAAFNNFYPELNGICSNSVICILTTIILPLGNSMCNPVIYALCDKEYRRTLKTTLQKTC